MIRIIVIVQYLHSYEEFNRKKCTFEICFLNRIIKKIFYVERNFAKKSPAAIFKVRDRTIR